MRIIDSVQASTVKQQGWQYSVSFRSYSQLRARNKTWGEEEHVTLVVGVVTAESPACTINRASCYMPSHMALLSKCEILIGSSFSIARRLNGYAKQKCFPYYQYSIFSRGRRCCLFRKTCTVTYTANFFDYTVVIFVDQSWPKDLTELMELCADQAEGTSCIL